MPDDPRNPDRLATAVDGRSTQRGDVPEQLKRRYYTDERGSDGVGFYVDARIEAPAFRDRGRELVAARPDPNAIRDMAEIARHRGWVIVTARGSTDFRREAWLAGRSLGLEVRGYQPTERDLQDLARRRERRERAEDRQAVRREWREDRGSHAADRAAQSSRPDDRGAGQMRVVEAVVRARVTDEAVRDRIIGRARERIADWLERGARFEPGHPDRSHGPERHRAR